MQHLGEIISLIVALSWTATAIFADIASHRLGALPLNLIRMGFSIVFLSVLLLAVMGRTSQLWTAVNDRQGMKFALLTTFFGPFLGVSLSLMAVQYANAGIASTLMALTPVLIIVPYSIINHQKISSKEILGTVITVTGAALFFLL